ncbi:unnamed protein product [Caenorhabditis angaria]|uniref:Tyrosine-protein kinase n=1 Tax=Caenorhabditis angaria TaxID=860376 RepID=A0A9P1MW34_9PELO|nr:unnamed protein product [Caenorhabditis angaria]
MSARNENLLNERIAKWLIKQTFYHGYLPRDDLPFILKKRGDFIVRTTERPTGKSRRRELVLSIAWPDGNGEKMIAVKDVRNIVIERSAAGCYIDNLFKFAGLDLLFEYYKTNPIKLHKTNVLMRITRPIGLRSWEYRHSQVLMVKKVGQGAYGEVFKGKLRKAKGKMLEVAVKTMKGDTEASDARMKEVMAEARLMRALNHPNIVRIRGIAVLEQPLYIIIDFINGGGLDSYLKKHASSLTLETKNKMAISAAWGLEFMHSQNILHRDIAARNCLYDTNTFVKLSDFGLSRKGETYTMKEARKMPTKWMSPESLTTFVFTRASDVYSYSVLLYEIYTCKEPFLGVNGGEAKKRILAGQFPSFEKESPSEMWNMVKKKIHNIDPKKRATMKEIVKVLEEWLQLELVLEAEEQEKEENDEPPAGGIDSKRRKSKSDNGRRTPKSKSDTNQNKKAGNSGDSNNGRSSLTTVTKDTENTKDSGGGVELKLDEDEKKDVTDEMMKKEDNTTDKDVSIENRKTDEKKKKSVESDEKVSEEKMSGSYEKVKELPL